MMRRPLRPRRAYTLWEFLIVIALVIPLMLVSGRLFVTSMKTIVATTRDETALARFQSATRQLRADVWTAQSLAVDPTQITLTTADAQPIQWIFAPDGTVTRQQSSSQRR